MSTILVSGKRFSAAAYRTRPSAFSGLLASAKDAGDPVFCGCTERNPRLVIRVRRLASGTRCFLATWPNRGHEHDPKCQFFVSDGDYQEAQERRDEAAAARGASVKTVEGVLRACFAGPPLAQGAGVGWAVAHERAAAQLQRLAAQASPLAHRAFLVPPFQPERKPQIEAEWGAFLDGLAPARGEKASPFLIIGEIKDVTTMDECVFARLRHHRLPVFMTTAIAAQLAQAYPREEAALNDAHHSGKVVAAFEAEITTKGNIWASNASLLLLDERYQISC